MKKKICFGILGIVALGLGACQGKNKDTKSDVVSQRYIHKYGYDVSKEEWNQSRYPGLVVTTLKNGVTVTASYEDGILHGQTTYTYPHSQVLESLNLYERGNLIKKVSYDMRGIPMKEDTYISPSHVKSKSWYSSGSPMRVEESYQTELIEGEYFTLNNEVESRVTKGSGLRTLRSMDGVLLAKEVITQGEVTSRETFYQNNTPQMVVSFKKGKLHGERKIFAATGEPISIENWNMDVLDGPATYFQNGYKYLEISYRNGARHGIERHFIDGEILSQETEWQANLKHGANTFYCDGMAKTEWYYNDEMVSKSKFDELVQRSYDIAAMHERGKIGLFMQHRDEE